MFESTRFVVGAALLAAPLSFVQAGETIAQELESFAVISGQSLTNTGPTTIDGNIAVWPGTSFTGSGTVSQTGETYLGDAVAQRIQSDLTTLYMALAGRPTTQDLTGQSLGGKVLTAGVYNFDSSADLATGETLTLDAEGNPNAIFIFNIGSELTAGPDAEMLLENGAQGGNVFFRIGSSATLDTSADLQGQMVALTSISMKHSATLNCGAAYARNGSVTLIANTINICTLTGNGFDDALDASLLTENQRSIAKALSDYVAGGGVLPIAFSILAATQTPEELAASLAQLSGETSTGVAPMGMQSMDAFLDTVLRSGRNPRIQQVVVPRDHGLPIGMVQDDNIYSGKHGSAERPQSPQTLAFSTTLAAPEPRNWDVWLSGYGSRNLTYGDASLGHQDRTSVNRGLAGGVNFSPSDRTNFGIAVSWNTADFSLSNGFGSGTSDSLFVAIRGRTSSDRAYLEGALAYGHSNITTDRTVTIAGTDRFIGSTSAETIAAHIEAGYQMGLFTPFVGLRAQSLRIPAYAERTVSGSSSYALQYEEHTTTSIRSELGVAMQWTANTAGLGSATFGIRAAWAHEFASNEPGTGSFVNVPGVSFPVSGATRDRDSLILAASARLTDPNGLFIEAAINTEFSRNSQDFGGSLMIGYRW